MSETPVAAEGLRVTPEEDGVLLVALDRPRALNALDSATVAGLGRVLEAARDDDAVRCVVLAGDERAFCAGADIKQMLAEGFAALERPERVAGWAAVESFPKPLIAAVEGVCLGAGNELAMLADFVIAGERARFGQPEVRIGVLPGDGGTQRLVRAVGRPLAMRMILSGEPIDAATALAAGLVAEVVPAGGALERALEIARVVAANAPRQVRMAKAAVLAAEDAPLAVGLRLERQALELAFHTRDREEGMRAFVEKRPPVYTGR